MRQDFRNTPEAVISLRRGIGRNGPEGDIPGRSEHPELLAELSIEA